MHILACPPGAISCTLRSFQPIKAVCASTTDRSCIVKCGPWSSTGQANARIRYHLQNEVSREREWLLLTTITRLEMTSQPAGILLSFPRLNHVATIEIITHDQLRSRHTFSVCANRMWPYKVYLFNWTLLSNLITFWFSRSAIGIPAPSRIGRDSLLFSKTQRMMPFGSSGLGGPLKQLKLLTEGWFVCTTAR